MVQNESGLPSLHTVESRRKFLQRVAVYSALLGSAFTASGVPQESKEVLPNIGERMVMIDFAAPTLSTLIKQDEYPSIQETIHNLVGDQIPSKIDLYKEFGTEFILDIFRDHDLTKQRVIEKYGGAALFAAVLESFSIHGIDVARRFKDILNQFGVESAPTLVPLQSAIKKENLALNSYNPMWGASFYLNIPHQEISQRLQQFNQRIINFSFQFGQFSVSYQEGSLRAFDFEKYKKNVDAIRQKFNQEFLVVDKESQKVITRIHIPPGLKIVHEVSDSGEVNLVGHDQEGNRVPLENFGLDTYLKEIQVELEHAHQQAFSNQYFPDLAPNIDIQSPYENGNILGLYHLAQLAQDHPDKLINAALGNYGEDIRQPRKVVAEILGGWPTNLLIWGQYNTSMRDTSVLGGPEFGADIYVPTTPWRGIGTSLSTALGSAVASFLDSKDLSISEIKKTLIEASRPTQVHLRRHELIRKMQPAQQLARNYVREVEYPDPEIHVVNLFGKSSLEAIRERYT